MKSYPVAKIFHHTDDEGWSRMLHCQQNYLATVQGLKHSNFSNFIHRFILKVPCKATLIIIQTFVRRWLLGQHGHQRASHAADQEELGKSGTQNIAFSEIWSMTQAPDEEVPPS